MKIMIGTPVYDGKLPAHYVDAMFNTYKLGVTKGHEIVPVYLCNDALVQRARNDLFQMAYDSKVDYLFFIDSDIIWNPEDFYKMLGHNLNIVLATYPKKQDLADFVIDTDTIPDLTTPLNDVNGGGTAFMCLSAELIKTVYEASPEYSELHKKCRMVFDIGIQNGSLVGEDILFCRKAKTMGYKIYLDNTINLTHIGQKLYSGNFHEYVKNFIEDKNI